MPLEIQEIKKEKWFKISNIERQRPFFMSVVSDSNHWMFISSNGGVSAGRKNAEYSLFPYYTDDKITDFAHTTGSKTIIQVANNGSQKIWEPFCAANAIRFNISRNLYKNFYGNKVRFEEINHDLNIAFSYEWNSSNRFGFVKKSTLVNLGQSPITLKVLDGIQNVLPANVNSDLQMRSSNLLDAYKRSELDENTGLGIFALSAIPVDKAEPSEALTANVVWSLGVVNATRLLSSLQLDAFRRFESITGEPDVKGEKGAYFVVHDVECAAGKKQSWSLIADLNLDHTKVIALSNSILKALGLQDALEADIEEGTKKLRELVAASDGFQYTNDELKDARHYSNVLFNIMRGGIFDDGYTIDKADFLAYLKNANLKVYHQCKAQFDALGDVFTKLALDRLLADETDPDLYRLSKEYLPLKFSRRHGDPSRPWNMFSINTKNELDGSKVLDYEGNWRDIFQNWEALVHSYPAFIEGMIFKFLNASTFDGYNPYRVTKSGFDWEAIEADDPWSYIGYWGDHQIIYLLKFLEFYQQHQPQEFQKLFDKKVFGYANVPYKIKPYADIVKNPKDTIDFEFELDGHIREQIAKLGADGAMHRTPEGAIHRVNFLEKILATVLSKISNFIPEGGIWMNTQRPEWNDANNALVGNGVSMVTLNYLHRFLKFFKPILDDSAKLEIEVSAELKELLDEVQEVLSTNAASLITGFNNQQRKTVTDGLGLAGSAFRKKVYTTGFSGNKAEVSVAAIRQTFRLAEEFLEQSIEANLRTDGLYHAYNLMTYQDDGIYLSNLDEMLEGQVAVLSANYLTAEKAVKVLDALRASKLYRKDQNSYILYPNKKLPGFLQRNSIPSDAVQSSSLLSRLVETGDRRIISRDENGGYHFNGEFKNAGFLTKALDELATTGFEDEVHAEKANILRIYEKVFNHKAFTGRSGTFYGYEGLGSVYWHMVSKLYLAVYEVFTMAKESGASTETIHKLASHFYEIGEGIGIHKSPELYGAFPTDPYSHTPFKKGAQQPGMTGQVKEDILARFGELGLVVKNGSLSIKPGLLRRKEFLTTAETVDFLTVGNKNWRVEVPENGIAFTLCQVPVVYTIGKENAIRVAFSGKSSTSYTGLTLQPDISEKLFNRTGEIKSIYVTLTENLLR